MPDILAVVFPSTAVVGFSTYTVLESIAIQEEYA